MNPLFDFPRYQTVLRVALPIIATSVVNILANIIGMLFVAHLGHEPLAAGALATSTFMTIMVTSTGTTYAVSILIAGANIRHPEKIKEIMHNALILGLILSVIIAFIFYQVESILQFFHQPEILISQVGKYFKVMTLAVLPTMIYMVFQQFFIGTGRSKINFHITWIGLGFNTFFAYIFVLGKFGFPALGLEGLALGQVLTITIVDIFYIIYLFKIGDIKKYQLFFSPYQIQAKEIWHIAKMGLPIGIQYGAELGAMAVATYFIGWLGSYALAASQVSTQLSMLAVMIFLGLSQALSVLVSQNWHQKQYQEILAYNTVTNAIGVAFMGIVTCLFLFSPNFFIQFYVNIHDPENQPIIHIATILLRVSGFMLIADGARNILAGALRGLHDTTTPMRLGVTFLWLVALPLAYLFAFPLHGGAGGVRFGFVVAISICTIILYRRFTQKVAELQSASS